jgi:hypothetical protein
MTHPTPLTAAASLGGANCPRGGAGIGVVKICYRAGLAIQQAADTSGAHGALRLRV